jgi:hypothetical protein
MAERADRVIEILLWPFVRLVLWMLGEKKTDRDDDPVGAHEDTF